MSLISHYYENSTINEIGVDEVGRGPMFGRVYAAAVILPRNSDFDFSKLKDSKKFHSKKKINDVSNYIKLNALKYSISYEEHNVIDDINIKNATHKAIHSAIKKIIDINSENVVLVDGNDFKLLTYIDIHKEVIKEIPQICIIGGDNKYCSIAAASILAKVARDTYIEDMCKENPDLNEKYDLLSNKGYGSKKHMAGIAEFGCSQWHRRTFGICKNYS